MKRVLVLVALAIVAGCDDKRAEPVVATRYEAVKAVSDPSARWCDSRLTGTAPRLTLPPLATVGSRGPGGLPRGKRVWLNLWATWCQPCLRELPLLLEWKSALRKDGVDVEVMLLSLDEDAGALDGFLAQHKDIAAAKVLRVASPHDYELWAKAFLKDPTTPIPIHLLASADGHLRCIRSGSLREGDYPAAKAALR